jgi:hypothetical protein
MLESDDEFGPTFLAYADAFGRTHSIVARFSEHWSLAQAIQLMHECKIEVAIGRLQIRDAATWLGALEV